MKYFINSQPKAGTYLCSNILANMGIRQSYLHVSEKGYTLYDEKRLDEGRKNPQQFFHRRVSNKQYSEMQMIHEGSFCVGHIRYNKHIDTVTCDWKRIILWRDIEEARESFRRWQIESGRNRPYNLQEGLAQTWFDKDNVFVLLLNLPDDQHFHYLNYDDLVNQYEHQYV